MRNVWWKIKPWLFIFIKFSAYIFIAGLWIFSVVLLFYFLFTNYPNDYGNFFENIRHLMTLPVLIIGILTSSFAAATIIRNYRKDFDEMNLKTKELLREFNEHTHEFRQISNLLAFSIVLFSKKEENSDLQLNFNISDKLLKKYQIFSNFELLGIIHSLIISIPFFYENLFSSNFYKRLLEIKADSSEYKNLMNQLAFILDGKVANCLRNLEILYIAIENRMINEDIVELETTALAGRLIRNSLIFYSSKEAYKTFFPYIFSRYSKK